MALKEGAERFRQLLLLVEGRSIVVSFDSMVGLVAGGGFNVPRLRVVGRKDVTKERTVTKVPLRQ